MKNVNGFHLQYIVIFQKTVYILDMKKNFKTAGLFALFIFPVLFTFSGCNNPMIEKILQPKTITFESNGGTPVKPQTLIKYEKIIEPQAPTKDNYFFGGWYTDNGSFEFRWNFDDIPEEDMTLYACWNYTETPPVGHLDGTPERRDFEFTVESSHYYGDEPVFNANVIWNENPKTVTVTPRWDISVGEITVYYEGINGTVYARSTNAPSNFGKYFVTFDVAAGQDRLEAKGLIAGTLTIAINVNTLSDYLSAQLATNISSDPYYIPLNINVGDFDALKNVLSYTGATAAPYVFLDLSGSNITTIPENAFCFSESQGIDTLTGIVLPDSVKSIGSSAFKKCTNLTSVTMNSVESIGDSAFQYCASLESVNIPNSVQSIEDNAFEGCTSLTSVTIPDSVTSIGSHAFEDTSLTNVTIPNSVEVIGTGAFSNCENLTNVTLPNNAAFTTISDRTFQSCKALKSVTIPDGVTAIGSFAFYQCYILDSIDIPNSVTSIGIWAFSGCSDLRNINLPVNDDFTTINDGTFRGCTSLTSITIPDSVTSIGNSAFSGCTELISIDIPKVTKIEDGAFMSCTNLTSVTLGLIQPTNWGENAFPGNLQTVYILNAPNGGPGKYTRVNVTWTKEQS
jgi:uncharacterized repeat protein (TIGR02543 family)